MGSGVKGWWCSGGGGVKGVVGVWGWLVKEWWGIGLESELVGVVGSRCGRV